jgi:hypothetical protein
VGRLPVPRALRHAGISMLLPLLEARSESILMRGCIFRVWDGERIGRGLLAAPVLCGRVDLPKQRVGAVTVLCRMSLTEPSVKTGIA